MIKLVRESSNTPNVKNIDDVRMIRYAYGFNGVVKNYGNELDAEYDEQNKVFKIKSGLIVLDGWEVHIDDNGWNLNISLLTGTQGYSIYLEVNALSETVEIKSTYNPYSSTYPNIDKGDDLTKKTNGIARLLLYNLTIQDGNADRIVKKIKTIPRLHDIAL